jgi:hypothetical protein
MSFCDGFAFTIGFSGALLLYRGVYLVLDDDLALDAARGLGDLFLAGKGFGLHALEVLVVLGFVREVVLFCFDRTGFLPYYIGVILFGFFLMFCMNIFINLIFVILMMILLAYIISYRLIYSNTIHRFHVLKRIRILS